MRSRPLYAALILAVGLRTLCGSTVRAEIDGLAAAFDAVRIESGIPAAAFFVVSSNEVLALEAFGTTARDTDRAMRPDHLIRIGSITKTVTALATMVEVEHGRLSLETRVAAVLSPPPYVNAWSATHPVTVAHLLEHTAGLRDLSAREFAFNEPVSLSAAFAVDPDSRRLRWPAGLHSSYSNSGAGIVSAVLEEISGRAFTTLVEHTIFRPLGMTSASFAPDAAARSRLITGYDTDGHTAIPYWHTLYPAFGGINVSTRDMVPFVQLFLNRGRHGTRQLVSERGLERMETPATTLAARTGLDYGYGLGVYDYERHGVAFHGHGGDADGYLAHFAYSTALDRGYFVVINAFKRSALRRLRRMIEDALIGDFRPAPPPAPVPPAPAHLRRLAGRYGPASARFGSVEENPGVEFRATADGLVMLRASGRERLLVPVSLWHYRYEDESRATMAFIACGARLYFQGDAGNFVKLDGVAANAPPCEPATLDSPTARR
jgi:CubicO group peptidase (beta-lactamase class C family)